MNIIFFISVVTVILSMTSVENKMETQLRKWVDRKEERNLTTMTMIKISREVYSQKLFLSHFYNLIRKKRIVSYVCLTILLNFLDFLLNQNVLR